MSIFVKKDSVLKNPSNIYAGIDGEIKNITSIWTGNESIAIPVWKKKKIENSFYLACMANALYKSNDLLTWNKLGGDHYTISRLIDVGGKIFGLNIFSSTYILLLDADYNWIQLGDATSNAYKYATTMFPVNNTFIASGPYGTLIYNGYDSLAKINDTGVLTLAKNNNSLFVSVNSIGQIYTSTNQCVTWNLQNKVVSPDTRLKNIYTFYSLICINNVFVFSGYFKNNAAYTSGYTYFSTNGTTWTQLSITEKFNFIACSENKAVAISSSGYIWESLDGKTWNRTSQYTNNVKSLDYINGKFIATTNGSNVFYYSNDNGTWSTVNTPYEIMSICYTSF